MREKEAETNTQETQILLEAHSGQNSVQTRKRNRINSSSNLMTPSF